MGEILKLKGGHYTLDRRLARVPVDHKNYLKNMNYDVRKTLKWDEPRTYKWECDLWIDQGSNPDCTGAASAHMLAAKPKVVTSVFDIPMGNEAALKIYEVAKENDEYPGDQYDGSSSLGAAKACVIAGKIGSYHWAFDAFTMSIVVSHKKPIVMGSNWYSNMMNVDADGFVHVSGSLKGGHEFCLIGFDVDGNYFWGRQSWGKEWSPNGDFKLSLADVSKLLSMNGDCWIPDAMVV